MARRPTTGTRERILSEALYRFAMQGFAGTSTREIADSLGLTKAALYYHFPTKDHILTALVTAAAQQFRQLLDAAGGDTSPRARARLLAAYVEYTAAHEDLIRVLTLDPSAGCRPAIHDAAPLGEALLRLLAGTSTPDAGQRARVHAALGAVHAALRHRDPADDPEVVRCAALAAACGALGLPAPGPSRRADPVPVGGTDLSLTPRSESLTPV